MSIDNDNTTMKQLSVTMISKYIQTKKLEIRRLSQTVSPT